MEQQLAEYRAEKLLKVDSLKHSLLPSKSLRNSFCDNANSDDSIATQDTRGSTLTCDSSEFQFSLTAEPSTKFDRYLKSTTFILKCLLWFILMVVFVKLEFGAVFFVLSCLYLIWTNLRSGPKKEGELSAYSVFNPNFETIDGTLTAEQFERELKFGSTSVR